MVLFQQVKLTLAGRRQQVHQFLRPVIRPGCRPLVRVFGRRDILATSSPPPTQAGAGGQNRTSRPLLPYRKVQRGFGRSALLIFTPPHAGGGCNANSHPAFGTIVTTTMTPYSPQAPQGQDRRRAHVCGLAFSPCHHEQTRWQGGETK